MFPNRIFPSRFTLLSGCSPDANELTPLYEDKEDSQELPLIEKQAFRPQNRISRQGKKSVKRRGSSSPKTSNSEGLCSNCDHRFNCAMRSQEGGVWHCEEYR
jgi:hypothetical protein